MADRHALALALAATLLACAAPRPSQSGPAAPAREAAPLDERQRFEAVLAIYRAHGLADPVALELSDDVLIPYAGGGAVHTWAFVGDGPGPAARVAVVSRALYGGRLDDWQGRFPSRADAVAGLEAFMTVALAHEVAHVIAARRGLSRVMDDPWLEETRAIRFERAALDALVEAGALPARALDDYVAFNRVLLSGAPDGLVASLPSDEAGRRARFEAGYGYAMRGELAGHVGEIDAVLALYTLARLEAAARPPSSWATLAAELTATTP